MQKVLKSQLLATKINNNSNKKLGIKTNKIIKAP